MKTKKCKPEDVALLAIAMFQDDVEKTEKLLKSGVPLDFYISNNDGTDGFYLTPLIHAIKQVSTDIVDVLIQYGADVNETDSVGVTPLDWAMGLYFKANSDDLSYIKHCVAHILQALVDKGAEFSTLKLTNDGRLVFAHSGHDFLEGVA